MSITTISRAEVNSTFLTSLTKLETDLPRAILRHSKNDNTTETPQQHNVTELRAKKYNFTQVF
jgi:hypothetical protein